MFRLIVATIVAFVTTSASAAAFSEAVKIEPPVSVFQEKVAKPVKSPAAKKSKTAAPVKSLLTRAQYHQYQLQTKSPTSVDDTDYEPGPDDLDLHRSYSRPRVVESKNDELSPYVQTRLRIARLMATQVHREIWG